MDQLCHAIAMAEQEELSQLHDAVAITIGRYFPINDQIKLKAGISFLSKMKVR
jgi:hypothetical protein